MHQVFIRIEEGKGPEKVTSCILLSDDQALEFINDPESVLSEYSDTRLIDSWMIPDDLRNASGGEDVMEAIGTLLGLDTLYQASTVSDLFATLFEAGYQLALRRQ